MSFSHLAKMARALSAWTEGCSASEWLNSANALGALPISSSAVPRYRLWSQLAPCFAALVSSSLTHSLPMRNDAGARSASVSFENVPFLQNRPLFSTFAMSVPSLSWQMVGF
eukprot:COSAG06_NODE_4333_length_4359_cov_33.125393_6_plen_112_part_00